MSIHDHRDEQEALLKQLDTRLRMSAFSRRKLVGGSIAGAGALALGGLPGSKAVMAQDTPELDEEQIFYNSALYSDPLTFDWNSNLYCNADVSTFSGLLMFNRR